MTVITDGAHASPAFYGLRRQLGTYITPVVRVIRVPVGPGRLVAISRAHFSGPDLVKQLTAAYIFLTLRRMPLMGYSGRLDRSWMHWGAPQTNASEPWECHGIA